jgi:hypothetical protein
MEQPVAGVVGGRRPVASVVGAAAGCGLETEACCRAELLSSGVGIFLQWAQPVRHVKLDGDGDQADF